MKKNRSTLELTRTVLYMWGGKKNTLYIEFSTFCFENWLGVCLKIYPCVLVITIHGKCSWCNVYRPWCLLDPYNCTNRYVLLPSRSEETQAQVCWGTRWVEVSGRSRALHPEVIRLGPKYRWYRGSIPDWRAEARQLAAGERNINGNTSVPLF